MRINPGSNNGAVPNIVTNLDELAEIQPELAEAIRRQEEQQVALLNEALKDMPPEEIIRRLKSLLWRLVPTLRLSEMVQMDFGSEVLSHSLRSALSGIVDAVKWIGWQNDIDPMKAFGDDTVIVALRDMMLGQDPRPSAHEGGLDVGRRTVENDSDRDDDEI